MPVPSNITDLSTTAGSNSPAGSETPAEGDNYIRSLSSFIAVLRDKLNGTSDTGTVKNATFSGTMAGAASWAGLQTFASGISVSTGGNVYSSTYSPTVTNVSDFASGVATTATYVRIGDRVTVSAKVTGDSLFNGLIRFRLSIPIASDFVATENCIGVANGLSGQVCAPGVVSADTTNNNAQISFQNAAGAVSWTVSADFSYRVI